MISQQRVMILQSWHDFMFRKLFDTCCQNRLMICEIISWFWQHQTCRSHRFFCDFPPWEPHWLHFSTVNSPKSSVIITLWSPYHYNINSSLTYMIIHPFHRLILWITLFLSNFNLNHNNSFSNLITVTTNSYPDILTAPQ